MWFVILFMTKLCRTPAKCTFQCLVCLDHNGNNEFKMHHQIRVYHWLTKFPNPLAQNWHFFYEKILLKINYKSDVFDLFKLINIKRCQLLACYTEHTVMQCNADHLTNNNLVSVYIDWTQVITTTLCKQRIYLVTRILYCQSH